MLWVKRPEKKCGERFSLGRMCEKCSDAGRGSIDAGIVQGVPQGCTLSPALFSRYISSNGLLVAVAVEVARQ